MNAGLVVVSLALATVVAALASISLAVPDIARDTGASQTALSWVVDSYALCFAVLLLPGGVLGDRFGRRRILMAGLVLFASASVGTVLAVGATQLIVGRVGMGVGAALVMPATLSTITATFPEDERDRGVAVWVAIAAGAGVIGFIVTGLVLEIGSYRWTFVLNVVLALVALIGTRWTVAESRQATERPLDIVGALLSVAGLAPIVYSIIEAPERGWTSAATVGGILGGCGLLAVFVGWELRSAHPLLDPRIFADLRFAAGTLTNTFLFLNFFGLMYVMMQSFQLFSGLSAMMAGLAISPVALGAAVGAKLVGSLRHRLPLWSVSPVGLVMVTLGMSVLALFATRSAYPVTGAALVLAGIGFGIATTVGTTAITDGLPLDQQGVASAVNDLAREVGGALGLALLGSVLTSVYRSELVLPPGAGNGPARDSFALALAMPPEIARAGREAFVAATQQSYLAAAVICAIATLLVTTLVLVAEVRTSRVEGRARNLVGWIAETE